MTAGLISKAQRGELALLLPVGLIRDRQGIVHKDPDQEIQGRLEMIFSSFLRLKSACVSQSCILQTDPLHGVVRASLLLAASLRIDLS